VVEMEAKTGFILAMVSRPSFDRTRFGITRRVAEVKRKLKPMLNG